MVEQIKAPDQQLRSKVVGLIPLHINNFPPWMQQNQRGNLGQCNNDLQ